MDSGRVTIEERPVTSGYELPKPSRKVILGLMVALVLYVLVRNVAAAMTRPIWCDEVLTMLVASQPNLRAMWTALMRGVDSHPPLFYLIEKAALHIVHNRHIAVRLPAILAFPCTLICVFAYVRKKSSDSIAFLCAVLLLLTTLFHTYATDGRAYGMLFACIAFALVCYQRAPSPFWTVMLALSLMLAESLHYYAIFSMLPFYVAESVYVIWKRRFRWQVWAALALGLVPLLFFWPLLSSLRTIFGTHVWTHYGLSSIPITYGSSFLTGGAFGIALVAVCIAGIIGARLLPVGGSPDEAMEFDPVEAALLLALLTLPFPTALATRLMHGAMSERYLQASVLGVVLAMACVMSLARGRVVLLFAIFVFSSVAIHEFTFWRSAHSLRLDNPALPVEALIQKAGHPDLPVVFSDGVPYMQLIYYAAPEWKKRFAILEDPGKALKYEKTDNVDKGFEILRPYASLQSYPLSEFVAAHPEFLFYVQDPGTGYDWLRIYFPEEASSMQPLVAQDSQKVYLVKMR